MNKTILFSLISTAMFSMGTANAGGGSLFGAAGGAALVDNVYVGGSLGQATSRCMISGESKDHAGDDECDMDGWKVFGGYKFTDNISAELGYYYLGDAEESYGEGAQKHIAEGESTGVGLTGVYSHELTPGFDVFGKAGLMRWNLEGEAGGAIDTSQPTSAEQDGTSFLYGVGASYKVTDNIGVRGEWERFSAEYKSLFDGSGDAEESDVDVLSAGVTFSTY